VVGASAALFAGISLAIAANAGAGHVQLPRDLSGKPMDLEGEWLFVRGDDAAYAAPSFDDGAWHSIRVPGGFGAQGHEGYAGFYWYRVHLHVDEAPRAQLSIQLGMIDSAYELFIDGVRVGGLGRVDDPVVEEHDMRALWPIDARAFDDGDAVIALRGRRSERRASSTPMLGGIWRGPQTVGETTVLLKKAASFDRDGIIASVAILLFGIYHLLLYRRRRSEASYLWFALFCLAIAGNMRMETQATHAFGSILRMKGVFGFLLLASVFFVQFLWPFLGERVRWWWRAHQAVVLVYWLCILVWPSTWFLDITHLWLHYVVVFPLMVGTTALIVRKAWAGDREARTLFAGTLALVAALGGNTLMDRFPDVTLPLLFPYAMILFVLSMAVSMSNRFARVFQELDTKNAALLRMDALADEVRNLNAHLQAKVRDRSEELSKGLAALVQKGGFGGVVPGTELDGRWRVEQPLGAGGMGTVYAGIDLVTGAPVAIKVVRADSIMQIESLHRFLREARAVVAIAHPAVVRMLHVDVSRDGLFYQVQELVEGVTLEQRLRGSSGAAVLLEAPVVARLGAVLAGALAAAHERGVIHRDVKPSNIMLTNVEPGVKLVDFGVAKLVASSSSSSSSSVVADIDATVDADHTGTGRHIGTPAYMAPEQRLASDAPITDRVDVYALGLLLRRALTGVAPTPSNRTAERPAASNAANGGKPSALEVLLSSCLVDEPRARPTASELAASLVAIGDELGAPADLVACWSAMSSSATTGGDLTRLMKELARST
jgi:tRNA A-37 threonylcarbamoyl transferase component Bud32